MKNFNLYQSFFNNAKLKVAGCICAGTALIVPMLTSCDRVDDMSNNTYVEIIKESAKRNYINKIQGIKQALTDNPEHTYVTYVEKENYYMIDTYWYLIDGTLNPDGTYEETKKLIGSNTYILSNLEAERENLTELLDMNINQAKNKR